jgi:AraC-like DNA-binding protein
MDLICDERESDSPFVERIWRGQGIEAGDFISMAEIEYGMVVTRLRGKTSITLRGPATRATPAFCPPDAEFVGIQFKPGVFMRELPANMVVERQDITLPESSSTTFWLDGSTWEYPDYENADTFVDWLLQDDLLVDDPLVDAVINSQPVELSLRTVQRRFLRATGLAVNTIHQINRALFATQLLKAGKSILDTVFEAGYFDQPHLTRALKRFVGLTPAQIAKPDRSERLSFLYKQNPSWLGYNTNVLRMTDDFRFLYASPERDARKPTER